MTELVGTHWSSKQESTGSGESSFENTKIGILTPEKWEGEHRHWAMYSDVWERLCLMFCQGNQDSKNQNQSTPKTVQAHQRPETRRLQPDSAAQSAPANPTAVAAENIFPPAVTAGNPSANSHRKKTFVKLEKRIKMWKKQPSFEMLKAKHYRYISYIIYYILYIIYYILLMYYILCIMYYILYIIYYILYIIYYTLYIIYYTLYIIYYTLHIIYYILYIIY